jgi:DNA-binding Lrp family transcriptional regulator
MDKKIVDIDAKDKRILYELEQNCRLPLGKIAKAVGLSKQTLHYRIQRLIEQKVIVSFITVINIAKLGFVNHEVWLQLEAIPEEEKEAFVNYLVNHKSIRLVGTCGGKFDFLIAVLAENSVQFNNLFREIIRKFPKHVRNYSFSIPIEFYTYPRTHFLDKEEKKKQFIIAGEPKRIELDETELKLLSLIAENSRIPTVELATKIGITAHTARAKIKRLELDGVIEGYKIMFDHSKIGYENYEILATLQNMTMQKEKELETYCALNPYSTFLLKCIGKWDIDFAFDAKNSEHFQQTLTDFRSRFGGIIKDYEFASIIKWEKFTYYPFK